MREIFLEHKVINFLELLFILSKYHTFFFMIIELFKGCYVQEVLKIENKLFYVSVNYFTYKEKYISLKIRAQSINY